MQWTQVKGALGRTYEGVQRKHTMQMAAGLSYYFVMSLLLHARRHHRMHGVIRNESVLVLVQIAVVALRCIEHVQPILRKIRHARTDGQLRV